MVVSAGCVCVRQMVELDAFFLKDVLLVPPESPLNIYRLIIWAFLGTVAIRDYYHFTENSNVKRYALHHAHNVLVIGYFYLID